jgi:hypothetical protein
MEKTILNSDITLCLTACDRNDLLFRTIDSFLNTNSYPIAQWLIKEDSGDIKIAEEIKKKYPFVNIISGKNSGQGVSIDLLYNLVTTKYIFHCEEDWYFEGNKDFIKQSIDILEEFKDVHQVWVRKNVEMWISKNSWTKLNNFDFAYIDQNHLDGWNGFSWNPGVRRLSDYKTMFPNGFKEFTKKYRSGAHLEKECMENTKKFNYKAAILKDCVCDHIGNLKPTKK